MKPLLSQCLIGYKFGRVNVDKDYFLCCRIPPIGNFNEDGTYKTRSGVIKNIPDNTKVMGYPAKDLKNFIRENK